MRGNFDFSVENVLSHSTESFLRGTFLCFRKFRVSESSIPKRGISRFSMKTLLSHGTEKLRTENFLSFSKLSGIEKFYG